MKKTLLLLVITILCAKHMNAQTPCEKTFEKAKNYYESNDYTNAMAQFQKVVNNCDSYKKIAQEYIKLCDGWLKLTEQQQKEKEIEKSAIDTYMKEINKLNSEKSKLEQKNKGYFDKIEEATNKMRKKDAMISRLQDSINTKLLPYMEGKVSLEASINDSLRMLGNELNAYLNKKAWIEIMAIDKKKIVECDTIRDVPNLISVIRQNLKLVTK